MKVSLKQHKDGVQYTSRETYDDRNNILFEAWAYCDWKDKSTEVMLVHMQSMANVSLNTVLNFIKKNSKNRPIWYKNNPNWLEKYKHE